ncbi:hypothetical protein SAMD00019534_046670 [Acytostelium subglobosum LB1]|uniref:hypothetical protein n=1 Tax=Acytostelium subglobosum LB1 TaxID=1410327 RepID=UPI000644BC3C|nr:hypothetical protein SAMD00019534_046670 [Acytostelium subglobosum LB1]GAM21492.1 hypothetical protein SAMD00019534_046670 [Acytostelium subglobosum LB1]|eukprot:XP_012755611.1 hypothetical protein SAMD00019534_046670 [Acytostelium subglobosum LB1]
MKLNISLASLLKYLLLLPIPIGIYIIKQLPLSLHLDRDKNDLLLIKNNLDDIKTGDKVTLVNPRRPSEIIVRTIVATDDDTNSFVYPTTPVQTSPDLKSSSITCSSSPFPRTLIKGKVIASLYCLGPL